MQLAKVIGDVVVTCKDANLVGLKLLVVQPIGCKGEAVGRTLVAADAIGAGVGETVFFVRGKEASFPFYPPEVPVDAGIVGIVDRYDVIDELTNSPRGATHPSAPSPGSANAEHKAHSP